MTVPSSVSLECVEHELEEAESIIDGLGLELDRSMLSEDDLRFRVRGRSRVDGQTYIVEFRCDDYREKPPFIEMIDPDSSEAGTRRAYPNCFHGEPCVCARFNRKTYSGHTDLHSEWEFGDWADEPTTDHLGGMISHIWRYIHGLEGNYSGRMA